MKINQSASLMDALAQAGEYIMDGGNGAVVFHTGPAEEPVYGWVDSLMWSGSAGNRPGVTPLIHLKPAGWKGAPR